MYISKKQGGFVLTEEKDQASAEILAPVIVEKGIETVLPLIRTKGTVLYYENESFRVTDRFKAEGAGLFSLIRKVENKDTRRRYIKNIFAVKSVFVPAHYVIPCLNYNGNEFGNDNTIKGLERDGQPWVAAYDRTAIPSASLVEDREQAVAIFTSDCDELSLRSSVSLIRHADGTMEERIFHPVTEAPYTYASKCVMRAPYEEYETLIQGEVKTYHMYLYACVPMYENFGEANLQDRVMDVFQPDKSPYLSVDRVWELGKAYSDALLKDCYGHTMSYTNTSPRLFRLQHTVQITPQQMAVLMKDPYYTELGQREMRFEIGWADQAAMYARMRAVDAIQKNDEKDLKLAETMLDDWVATQKDNGLLYPQYQNNFPQDTSVKANPDTCNMGWAIMEFTRDFQLFRSIGRDKPQYLRFAEKIADFFTSHYNDEYGFGKSWSLDGDILVKEGTVGGFIIAGLMVLYEELPKKEYLDCAEKAMDFYFSRDLNQFVCSAGALDCLSIDKETSYPFIRAGLALYRVTGEEKYLDYAKKALYYFDSWMFLYDVLWPQESEAVQYRYFTTGGTFIGVEHHGIDPWGAVTVPEHMEMYRITGDERWLIRAKITWAQSLCGLCDEQGRSFHGQVRPLGSQSEGFSHCRFTKYRPSEEERGNINDCLSGWMGAYRMNTVYTLSEEDKELLR